MAAELTPTFTALLRSPSEIAGTLTEGRALRAYARISLLAIAFGGVVFGAVVGSQRGGIQIVYGASKLPLVLLLSLSVTVPAVYAITSALDRTLTLGRVAALVLASNARAALVLLALAPAVALGIALWLDYHDVALASAIAFGMASFAGSSILRDAMGKGSGRALAVILCLGVQSIVTMQVAWTLRPWVVRPASNVEFVRSPEGTAVQSVTRTTESAAGIYDPQRSIERAAERNAYSGGSR